MPAYVDIPVVGFLCSGQDQGSIAPPAIRTAVAYLWLQLQRHYPTSNTQFQTLCAKSVRLAKLTTEADALDCRKANCVIVAASKALTSQQEAIISTVAEKRRKTVFVHVNPLKMQLNLGMDGHE